MNKTVKIISVLLMTIMLVTATSQVVLGAGDVINGLGNSYKSNKIDGVTNIAVDVLTAIRNIAVIVAVIMISVLGVKYMIGSAEEKAGYKKAFVPMIVGAILVVSAAQIAKMLFSINA